MIPLNSTKNFSEYHNLNFNESLNVETLRIPFYTILISANLYLLIFVAGCIGNCIVIYVVMRNKILQHNTNYCLVNLSIADLLLLVVCMPSAFIDLFSEEIWYFGYLLCKITNMLENMVVNASVLTISSICIERYLAISKPLIVKKFTKQTLTIVIVLIWSTSIITALPYMIVTSYSKGYHKKYNQDVYICHTHMSDTWLRVYLFVCLVGFYIIPCILLFYQYGRIIHIIQNLNPAQYNTYDALRKNKTTNDENDDYHLDYDEEDEFNNKNHSNKTTKVTVIVETVALQKINSDRLITNNNRSAPKNSLFHLRPSNKHHKQTTKMLFVMMIVFFICILPLRIFSIWVVYATRDDLAKLGIENYYNILTWARIMFYLNSAINPILYHILSTKFQTALKRTFNCYCTVSKTKTIKKKNISNRRVRFHNKS